MKDSITNEIVGIGTVSSNIEEEKRNDEVLHRAFDQIETEERKFRNLVENAPVGIAILKGNDFTVELANIEALKILGKKEKDVRNIPLLSILPAQDNNLHNVLKKVLKTGESQRGLEFSLNIKVRGREVKTFFQLYLPPYNG